MRYIEYFIANLFASIAGFGGTASTMHSTTTIGGTETTTLGLDTINEANDPVMSLVGTGVASLGTSVVNSSDAAMNQYQRQVSTIRTSQAYIESLPESDIDELIASLSYDEQKDNEGIVLPKEEVKTLTKKL